MTRIPPWWLSLPLLLVALQITLADEPAADDSAAVEPTVTCLSVDRAKIAMLDKKYDDFFGGMQRREIATMTGQDVQQESLSDCRAFARRYFRDAVIAFQADEEAALRWYVAEIDALIGDDYPMVSKGEWNFIRVRPSLCGGFSFTRNDAIIIGRPLKSLVAARKEGKHRRALARFGPLLVHERFHVLQRQYPDRFSRLYEGVYGYRRIQVEIHPWINQRQIGNPDGQDEGWVLPLPSSAGPVEHWLGTILKGERAVPRMGRDFLNVAVPVQKAEGDTRVMSVDADGKPIYRALSEFPDVSRRFPEGGAEHPNEVSANMFAGHFRELLEGENDRLDDDPVKVRFREWCARHLR